MPEPVPQIDHVETQDPELSLLDDMDALVTQQRRALVARVHNDEGPQGDRSHGDKPRHKARQYP